MPTVFVVMSIWITENQVFIFFCLFGFLFVCFRATGVLVCQLHSAYTDVKAREKAGEKSKCWCFTHFSFALTVPVLTLQITSTTMCDSFLAGFL